MRKTDSVQRFVFEHLAVRGVIARLDTTWETVQARRDYPEPIRELLGEALAAVALLHTTVKFEGLMTMQLQSKGPVRLLVVQCSDRGELRALARWGAALPIGPVPLSALCAEGTLAITIEQRNSGERYQGVVDLSGDNLTAALELYFERSEQLPTRVQLAADHRSAAGFMVQRLPRESLQLDDRDGWNRIQHLSATLSPQELIRLETATLIRRLFHEELVRLYRSQPLQFSCTCSRARTEAMLVGLGRAEVQSIIEEQGQVDVACEFCGQSYHFDAVDAEQLFGAPQPDVPSTRH